MNKGRMDFYLEKVPIEIRDAVVELNNDQKWAVYLALTFNKEMYFNEIKKHFEANPNTMTPILKSLVASGLIAKKVKRLENIGDGGKVYYRVTNLGEKFLTAMYDTILPPLRDSSIIISMPKNSLTLSMRDSSTENFQYYFREGAGEDSQIPEIRLQKEELYVDHVYYNPVKV